MNTRPLTHRRTAPATANLRPSLARRSVAAGLGALALAPFAAPAQPRRQIQIVVHFPPGGVLDTLARVVAQKLAEQTPDVYVVDNRAGANGNIGARAVAQARPDGNTWLFGSDALVTVNPALYARQMGFDPDKALKVVAAAGSLPSILVVNPGSGPKTLTEFVERARREEVSYASGGIGSAGHLTMEYFGNVAGLKLRHVPYRGGAPAMTDLVAGQVQAAFVAIGNALDHARSGALRPLAVSSAGRVAALPEVPTVRETGFPEFEVATAFFVWVPAATPADATTAIEGRLREALADGAVQERMRGLGLEPMAMPPAEATRWLAAERARWTRLIADRGITAE